jgi:hypothetical protein
MSQVPVDQNDPRSRYTHQAYDVTYFGKALESGPSGYGKRLSGTYQSSILLPIDMSTAATIVLGDLTQGIYSFELVVHAATTAAGAVTLQLADVGEGATTLLAIADTSAATPGPTALTTPIAVPLPADRPLQAVVGTIAAGETFTVSLLATPAENGWF